MTTPPARTDAAPAQPVTNLVDSSTPVTRAHRIFEDMKRPSEEVDLSDDDLEVIGDRAELSKLSGGRWLWMEAAPTERQRKLVSQGRLHLFGTRGAVSALTFGEEGSLSFRRRFVHTRRERITAASQAFRRNAEDTLWSGLGMLDEYGMHENHATAVYPMGDGRILTQSEGSRPMLLSEEAGTDNDLQVIGPVGDFSDTDPTAPWFRTPYTSKPIGRLLLPDIAGSRWPTTNGPTHPSVDRDSGMVYLPVRREYARPVPVDSAAARARARRFGVLQAYLHTVVWDPATDRTVRVDIRDRNGRKIRIRWGLHQSMVDDRYLVIVDSGFPAEHRQFGPVGRLAKEAAARRHRPSGWAPGYTGVLPLKTRIYLVEKSELNQRLDAAWASGSKRIEPVRAQHFDIDGSCIHAYSGRTPGSMALLVTETFDPSEWMGATDEHLDGGRVNSIMRGFGHGDWAPGHVQYAHFKNGEVTTSEKQPLAPGGQFAAEAWGEPTDMLQCTSQGVWPELLTKRVTGLYPDPEPQGPLRTARVARHSGEGILDYHDTPWGFPFGSAESGTHLMVGLKYAGPERSEDRLLFYRRDDLSRGPVAEVRSKQPGALAVRLGLHGHYRRA
jgi:hypothetical protein